MDAKTFSCTDLQHIFRMNRNAQATLIAAERAGRIPTAERVKRGSLSVRRWGMKDVPLIGQNYGWIKAPQTTRVICIYTPKGGILKSTLCHTISRVLAINGLRVLIIGLDSQMTITDLALNPPIIEKLDDIPVYKGLADLFEGRATLEEIIQHCDLPTLDVIPETPRLSRLEKLLFSERGAERERYLKKQVIDKLRGQYDVIVIDNSPSYSVLIENALAAANVVISPLGCDINSYQTLDTNLRTTEDVRKSLGLTWDTHLLIPTLLEKTKISGLVYAAYLNKYSDRMTTGSIRRAVKGQEAVFNRVSPIEDDPRSELARDYHEIVAEVWSKILADEAISTAQQEKSPVRRKSRGE